MESVSLTDVTLKLDANGLIPAVVQQEGTGEVLMVAWMSEESLRLTFETGTTWFWSRSRKELWNKGATSGNMQKVRRILIDCDADTLVVGQPFTFRFCSYLTLLTIALKASGLLRARSASTLRLISMPAFANLPMRTE